MRCASCAARITTPLTLAAAHNVMSTPLDTSPARSTGLPPWMGKATAELKCKVPDALKDEFMRLAHSLGMDESRLLRELVMVRIYGLDEVLRMQQSALLMVAGSGPTCRPESLKVVA